MPVLLLIHKQQQFRQGKEDFLCPSLPCRLHCSGKKVYRLFAKGKEACKVGPHHLPDVQEVHELLKQQRQYYFLSAGRSPSSCLFRQQWQLASAEIVLQNSPLPQFLSHCCC